MNRMCFALLIPLAVVAGIGRTETDGRPAKIQLLVPAYFYPAGPGLKEWNRMSAAAGRVPIVAIVNPASGPGRQADANYTSTIARAHKSGVRLVGYVSSAYAKRPLADVKADMDLWPKLYSGLSGFFIDEQASAADKVGYYAELYVHGRKVLKDGLIITNPGTICAREFLAKPASDSICIFENSTGLAAFQPPPWAPEFKPSAIAALVHKTETAAAMEEHLKIAVKKRIGLFYATDATGVNPWDRLPTYWEREIEAVAKINASR